MPRDAKATHSSLVANPGTRSGRRSLARRFRWWEKKRGSRQTGSKILGGAAEALFFAVLFFVGILALTELVVLRLFADSHGFLTDGWGLWLSGLVLASLILIGAGGLIYTAMMTGTSAERRSALAKRARTSNWWRKRAPEAGNTRRCLATPIGQTAPGFAWPTGCRSQVLRLGDC